MPHFCGRTHSNRDRHIPMVGDERPAVATRVGTGTATLTAVAAARPLAGTVSKPPAAPPAPTHQQIAALAYSYWEARGRQGGSAEADWLRAEKELSGR